MHNFISLPFASLSSNLLDYINVGYIYTELEVNMRILIPRAKPEESKFS